MPSTDASNRCGEVSSESQEFEDPFGGTAEHRSVPRQRHRALDQTRVLDHRRDQPLAAERLVRQPELAELLLLAPHELPGFHPQNFEDPFEFGGGWRVFQILDDLGFNAAFAQQADRPT
jgi:hypothetical protein